MKATIIGATGLIGSQLLEYVLRDKSFSEVVILVRRKFENTHPKLKVQQIDFSDLQSFDSSIIPGSIIFCAVGTTKNKVKGDLEKYRSIDYDIAVNAAKFGLEKGCKSFILVSSIGANSKSSNFYTRLKGEIEERISSLQYPSFQVFRPSILLGNRKEFRFGEKIAKYVMSLFSFVMPDKFKPIQSKNVALAMLNASKEKKKGTYVYTYKEIKDLAHN